MTPVDILTMLNQFNFVSSIQAWNNNHNNNHNLKKIKSQSSFTDKCKQTKAFKSFGLEEAINKLFL